MPKIIGILFILKETVKEQETGVVDPKRWVAQSTSGRVTHTLSGWMYARCMQHDICDTDLGHIKIVMGSVLPLCQV